ncbi:serine hydrolase domain-containing protein [Hymenobacter actinosclerus]|uniref:CubicO group peptidase, beta-lactamase class C family n=1 Tax=Hymenobacter actinosclerus TaxID=82805 RepID=A0A1I0DT38_9BACT|nr:serine hydrolase domain-containing protein [Hymenobacter actinosclerus]SET35130.1 CubicO group peptidase, beta-lactamase class C family [Hymenobacter actinosclerus]
MRYLLLLPFVLLLTRSAAAQTRLDSVLTAEYQAGHFNGAVLAITNGRVVARVNRGYANLQFAVPITDSTRFPIASMTKTFTALLTLQLQEQGRLKLTDKAAAYLPELPANCQNVTLLDLLTHYSGLKNEPVQAYAARLTTLEFVRAYVVRDETKTAPGFNYNNVDYILLTRVLEAVSGRPYPALLQALILTPLGLKNTGVLTDQRIIANLAYGYHNYSFGENSKQEPLKNDNRELANYAGAGAVYSTAADLGKLVEALRTHRLLRPQTTAQLLIKPQQPAYLDYARGRPSIGFYVNNRTFAQPVLERRGSIEGFNSALLVSPDFRTTLIMLCNTDTGDLEKIGDALYPLLK